MYLGIDLGTSAVKALLIDQQRVVASATSSLEVVRPNPGWSEQNPMEWIRAAEKCLDELKESNPNELAMLKGIGLSGQMHGATLLDSQDKPLRPCILWNDTRSHEEAMAMNSDPRFQQITGNLVFPGFTAPKLAWVRKNEPEVFASISKVLLPKDFLRLWLTGEYISDMSDSAGTSWLNMKERRWSIELLEATGLNLGQMPRLAEGTEPAGTLRPELARRWGITNAVIVAGGAGDNAASACGVGTVQTGTAFISIGTSGVLFAASDAYRPNPTKGIHIFCHALPKSWHQMGVLLSAADSLSWLSRITGSSPNELTTELGDHLRAPTNVTFLPYLSGERTPHNDASIRGSFTGLSHQTDRVALTQAVLEGVAFAFRDCLEALQQSGTDEITRIIAIGGGSRCVYWLKAIATSLGIPIEVPAEGCDLGAAFGAARLALIAVEGAHPFAVCTPPAIATRIEPDDNLKLAYDKAYDRYRDLYPSIKSL